MVMFTLEDLQELWFEYNDERRIEEGKKCNCRDFLTWIEDKVFQSLRENKE